jgi:integrase
MNDITGINWKKVSKVLPEPMKVANDRPYTREEIARMLEKVDDRGKVVILLMCSTGMRQGAIPTLIVGDCKKTETGIYTITVYRNSSQQYTTMCSFECAQAIDSYLEYRQRCGEKIIATSPLIRQSFDKKTRPLADTSMKNIILRALNDAGLREKRNVIGGERTQGEISRNNTRNCSSHTK